MWIRSSVLDMMLISALNISPTRRDAHVSQRCSMGGDKHARYKISLQGTVPR